MSELPAYRSTPIGMSRNRPFTRPATDSLPKHECPVNGCGTDKWLFDDEPEGFDVTYTPASLVGSYVMADEDARHLWFCSLGCLGRWAAREELTQP